jgi:hypothetical protein
MYMKIYTTTRDVCTRTRLHRHDELLLRLQIKMADATAHVTAPSAKYRFRLS